MLILHEIKLGRPILFLRYRKLKFATNEEREEASIMLQKMIAAKIEKGHTQQDGDSKVSSDKQNKKVDSEPEAKKSRFAVFEDTDSEGEDNLTLDNETLAHLELQNYLTTKFHDNIDDGMQNDFIKISYLNLAITL